ncbi:hypothetical protein Pan216_21120 [Planctomycetes bacterium Pan216]|uniref:Uncharacterized protein n=1 Tax=Kolteria novifilia TaxID=2527975 RepID=A0A518B2Q6_9BACT|nr:hypothetical protein Pan216_21120 [Planctomycetes bacterium Pan216]
MSNATELDMTLLYRFCGEPYGRHNLAHPFARNGWIYATDGCICARVPDEGQLRMSSTGHLPKGVDHLNWDWVDEPGEPVTDESATDVTLWAACDKCRKGFVQRLKCERCDIDGECPHCHRKCNICDGLGYEVRLDGFDWRCFECKGTGWTADKPFTPFRGEGHFYASYLRLVSMLPNVRASVAFANNEPRLRFVFDYGGQGQLMGVIPREDMIKRN